MRGAFQRAPLTWFFILAYALSWLAWTPYILSENGLGVWDHDFGAGGSGQILGILPGAYLGPICSALLITSLTEGRQGLRNWRARMVGFRVGWHWYLLVMVSVPAALTLATIALTDTTPVLPAAMILAVYLPGLLIQMITTGLAEEPGWREFAMPRMQNRYGPLVATFIVGVLWGAWHLPLFLTDWGVAAGMEPLRVAEFLVTALAFSYVMTWVFNRSRESMPLVMLLHTSVNNFFSLAWSDMFPELTDKQGSHAFLLAAVTAAIIVLAATRGRLGYVAGRSVPPTKPPTKPEAAQPPEPAAVDGR
ncbi:CPBP family intramembrane metalloprotease [Streptomyces paludis]|uniref:CPBP family intramembrane metalloprotease n=1 Tax=Streptomyces paludis TaxID=2282738 RepID=A0A345I1F3_9ACTN|nr:CPBP family intramembrane metalloprotease [Streptomyces paludis]